MADNGEIVKFLVQKGAEDDLSNLLMLAVRYGKELTKSVKVLVNLGADVNKVCQHTKDTMLIIAAQKNHMEIVKFLLEKGADSQVDCKSRFWCLGKDTLIYAANFGNLDIVKLLLAKGANINVQDKIGNSPLMMAARYVFNSYQALFLASDFKKKSLNKPQNFEHKHLKKFCFLNKNFNFVEFSIEKIFLNNTIRFSLRLIFCKNIDKN